MKRLTAKEKDQMITDMAHQVMENLKGHGAKRQAHNATPTWRCKDDICKECDIPVILWGAVKERAWELGLPLAHDYYTGWYVGFKGEQMRCMKQHETVIKGIANSASRAFMAFGNSGTLQQGKKVLAEFGISLCDFPTIMKALGKPLPREAEQLLLEAGDDDDYDHNPPLEGLA